jgi:hypothetical protein
MSVRAGRGYKTSADSLDRRITESQSEGSSFP